MAKKKVYTLNRNWMSIPRSGGGGGYEPDEETIGFTTGDKLQVVDYISATETQRRLDELDDLLSSWALNTFCTEQFAVELDGRLEDVEELVPSIQRALLIPVSTITSTELVGIGSDKEQKRVKIGTGLGYDSTTDTLYATGGGGGVPTVNITGSMDYQEKIITITSPSYKSEIQAFKTQFGYFPNIKLTLSVYSSGTLVQTGEYEKTDAQIVNNTLTIWFANSKIDTVSDPQMFNFSEIIFTDNGTVMSGTFNSFESDSFHSDHYYDKEIIDEKLNLETRIASYDAEVLASPTTFTARVMISYKTPIGSGEINNWFDLLNTATEINDIKVYNQTTKEPYSVIEINDDTIRTIAVDSSSTGAYQIVEMSDADCINDLVIDLPLAKKSKKR